MLTCPRSECTVAETGRCILNNDPATCPERTGAPAQESALTEISTTSMAPPLEAPAERPRFPHSLSFGPDDIREITSSRYHFLAGILGSPRAGKTALLVSLYLLAANNKLEGYQIADSHTLMGLDEISRGARGWNEGQIPDEMTIHTELADERTPGFLHLRLKRISDRKALDLLMPDLPGEWSDALINHKRTDRLSFLKSADILWVTVDGADLAQARQQVLHRTQLLFQRIKNFLGNQSPKIVLVISHLDRGEPEARSIKALQDEADRLGLALTVRNVASFSDADAIPPGTGLLELLAQTFDGAPIEEPTFWPISPRSEKGRFIARFRTDEGTHA
jgi:hypothetical protein